MTESQYIFEFCDSYNKRILKQKKNLRLIRRTKFNTSKMSALF